MEIRGLEVFLAFFGGRGVTTKSIPSSVGTDEEGPFGVGGAFRGKTFLADLVKSITSSLASDEEGSSGAGDTFFGRTFRADLVPHDSGGTVKAGVLRGR